MKQDIQNIIAIARHYCDLIEHCDNESWLPQVAELLPQIHAAIARIKSQQIRESGGLRQAGDDLDSRFDLYVELKSLLGENDSYWLEYDFDNDMQQMSGSLADDLTDIYYELKEGLEQLKKESISSASEVLTGWRKSYQVHWGQHLVDAERHLYVLGREGRL